ncbi:MAG: multicopper oxidase domain-containing protein, partial [Syntrophobacteraceae bacterium]|nr:multicopper oxidase domain-containing protein [Syntrophobacteraceae bacterium]
MYWRRNSIYYRASLMLMLLGAGLLIAGSARASDLVSQTPYDAKAAFLANTAPLFTSPLPVFGPGYNAALPRVNATAHPYLTVKMVEFNQQVMPASLGFGKARLWGYETLDSTTGKVLAPPIWPGVTVEAKRNKPTVITYQNDLPSFNPGNPNGPGLVQGLITSDPTIHWANPLDPTSAPVRFPATMADMMKHNPCMETPTATFTDPYTKATIKCNQPFTGPQPTVPHLHGAEIPSYYDGGPDGWFTPTGIDGPGYSTFNALDGGAKGTGYTKGPLASTSYRKNLAKQSFIAKPGTNQATYIYDNAQEPGTLWFHDHGLGITRTNVSSGLEAFYFIRQPAREPQKLPAGAYEIEMAIQDRQFDSKGQLYFPDGYNNGTVLAGCGTGVNDPCLNGPPPNPAIHPFWIPESIGDVAVVNGAPWPVLKVEPRRYLFRLLDGANARMWNLTFGDAAKGESLPPVYVVGNDDNYLDAPAPVSTLLIAPGQRDYVIVDFSKVPFGSNVTLTNDAPVPYPGGLSPVPYTLAGMQQPADQPQMHYIMRFQVTVPLKGKKDTSCNPTVACKRPTPLVSLNTVTKGGVKVDKHREVTLKEFEGIGQFGNPGGPAEVLVQNTKWDGLVSPGIGKDFPVDGISELPQQGAIEEWDIVNLTIDAHPMHTHLVQFQILNRQSFDTDGTLTNPTKPGGGYIGYLNPTTGAVVLGAWAKAFYPSGTTFDSTGAPSNPPECNGLSYVNPDHAAFNPCPAYGPPLSYLVANGDGAIGGNPAVGPYLVGSPTAPSAYEA